MGVGTLCNVGRWTFLIFLLIVVFLDYKQKKASVEKGRFRGWVDQEKQLDGDQRAVGAEEVMRRNQQKHDCLH